MIPPLALRVFRTLRDQTRRLKYLSLPMLEGLKLSFASSVLLVLFRLGSSAAWFSSPVRIKPLSSSGTSKERVGCLIIIGFLNDICSALLAFTDRANSNCKQDSIFGRLLEDESECRHGNKEIYIRTQ